VTAYTNWQQIRSLERERVNIDEVMADAELVAIAKAKAGANGNGAQSERYCQCDEYIINGKRVPCPPGHSCELTRKRSELVPEAVKLADSRVTRNSPGWQSEFNRQMNRLAFNAGLLR
jgi:hypothetical protein